MSTYAKSTKVSTDRSRAEIEKTLTRYGASAFMYGWEGERAVVAFQVNELHIRIRLQLPAESEFDLTPKRKSRTKQARSAAHAQAVRQRWRALLLVIKAKLEAVESGIATFESEFLAYVVLPDGRTAGDWLVPQIEHAQLSGRMPPLMLPDPNRDR